MQQSIIEAYPDAKIEIQIVWGAILKSDTRSSALGRAAEMPDPRVTHYWDSEELVGKALAPILPIGEAPFAWDVYLFYDAEASWGDEAPVPASWAHQLSGADSEHFYGGKIAEKLAEDMRQFFGKGEDAADRMGREEGDSASRVEPTAIDDPNLIRIDTSKQPSLAELLLEDVLGELGDELSTESVQKIKERFRARVMEYPGKFPLGVRFGRDVLVLPESVCLPELPSAPAPQPRSDG